MLKKPENQKAEKGMPGKHYDINLTAVVVFKSFLTTKSVDFIQVFKRMRRGYIPSNLWFPLCPSGQVVKSLLGDRS